MFAARQSCCSSWSAATPLASRNYALSVAPPKELPGKRLPRVFKDKKAFQYNWYMKILGESRNAPLLFLHHDQFSAQRLAKLRRDIYAAASRTTPSLLSPAAVPAVPPPRPTLTVIRTSIFGAALRDFPGVNIAQAEQMIGNTTGGFAVLSFGTFDPPQLSTILRALDRSAPPRKPKTPEEIKKEEEAKNADPAQPGRRMKRVRKALNPELKLVGALIDGRVFLPEGVKEVSTLPTLDTLRAQIVGLISAPANQLAGLLGQASGGKLSRVLEGLKKGLEEEASGSTPVPP